MYEQDIFQVRYELDNNKNEVEIGEKISGKVFAKTSIDIAFHSFYINCNWTTRGRGTVDSGRTQTKTFARNGSWKKDVEYSFDFSFPIKKVLSFHGKNLQIIWQLSPILDVAYESKKAVKDILFTKLNIWDRINFTHLEGRKQTFYVVNKKHPLKIQPFHREISFFTNGQTFLILSLIFIAIALTGFVSYLYQTWYLMVGLVIILIMAKEKLKEIFELLFVEPPNKIRLDYEKNEKLKLTLEHISTDLKSISFQIKATETARFEDGSDSKTYKHLLCKEHLEKLENPKSFQELSLPFPTKLQVNPFPTFKSENNRIDWVMRLIFEFENGKTLEKGIRIIVKPID